MFSSYSSFSKEIRLKDLSHAVQSCDLCTRLRNRTKVLSEENGNVNSKLLFIAEAPGRLGADRTGIPLFGDKSGDNFELLLGNIGWNRSDVFITNAILCNPRSEEGNNCTPTLEEITNCNAYLEMTINLINPKVIVTLGSVALEALSHISPHNAQLKNSVCQNIPWLGKTLIPLYHTGPRAMIHRSLSKQRSDFIKLAKYVHPVYGIKDRKGSKSLKEIKENDMLAQTVITVVRLLGEITYFKITKILYLVDLLSIEQYGRSITGSLYLRQQEGPWPPELWKTIEYLNGYEILFKKTRTDLIINLGPNPRFNISLKNEEIELIDAAVEKYANMDNKAIKIATYRTKPMSFILKEEKKGRDMLKQPIIYKNKTILDGEDNK